MRGLFRLPLVTILCEPTWIVFLLTLLLDFAAVGARLLFDVSACARFAFLAFTEIGCCEFGSPLLRFHVQALHLFMGALRTSTLGRLFFLVSRFGHRTTK